MKNDENNNLGIIIQYPGIPLEGDDRFKNLYHFTSFDAFVRIWLSQKLKFGSMLNVNDIQESMKGISVSNPSHLPVIFAFQDMILKYKQISFTMDADSFLKGYMNTMMWGYYADKCHGLCIEFDYEKLKIPHHAFMGIVKYTELPPQRANIPDNVITIKGLREYIENKQESLFFTKQNGWRGENEFRIVCNTLDYLDIKGAINCVYLTSYDSEECKLVEQLVDDEIEVKYLHYFNGLPVASEAKNTKEKLEKIKKGPNVMKQLSDQAKRFYEENKNDENFPLVLNSYTLDNGLKD